MNILSRQVKRIGCKTKGISGELSAGMNPVFTYSLIA